MIRYSLVCGEEHGFDAWFRDSAAFDDLDRDGHLACPQCGSAKVRKALMAPSIRRLAKKGGSSETPTADESEVSKPVPVVMEAPPSIEDDKSRQMRAFFREMHLRVKSTAENVGAAFSKEARKIHDGDEPHRSIYGTATGDEVRSLIEDGVSILPLPPLPDEHN